MKKNFYLAAAIMATVLAGSVSCQDEDTGASILPGKSEILPDSQEKEKALITFTAGDADSDASIQKTMYDTKSAGTILWKTGDNVAIRPVNSSSNDKGTILEGGKSTCEISAVTSPADGYFALYPYEHGLIFADGKFKSVFIPLVQNVSEGQFDPQADVMVAYANGTDKNFAFKHVVSKLGITVPYDITDKVYSIVITASTYIAGSVDVDYTESSSEPQIELQKYLSRSITLTCDDGFERGKTYYACMIPNSNSVSLKIEFFTNAGRTEGRIARGKIDLLKRAMRNMAAPPQSKDMLFLTQAQLKAAWPALWNTNVGSAQKIGFGYKDGSYNSNYIKTNIDGLYTYTVKIDDTHAEYYFLSEKEICMTGSLGSLFAQFTSTEAYDFSNFNTEQVTSMGSMFSANNALTSLDLSGFNTEKVTNMSGMFNGSIKLATLDLSGFNTGNVTTMENMFKSCTKLKDVYATLYFNASNAKQTGMFANNLYVKNVSDFKVKY